MLCWNLNAQMYLATIISFQGRVFRLKSKLFLLIFLFLKSVHVKVSCPLSLTINCLISTMYNYKQKVNIKHLNALNFILHYMKSLPFYLDRGGGLGNWSNRRIKNLFSPQRVQFKENIAGKLMMPLFGSTKCAGIN